MTRPARPRPAYLLPLALCGGLLLGGIITAAPAAALTPPMPPPDFAGPGGCASVTPGEDMLCLWVDQDPARRPLFVKTVRTTFTRPNTAALAACDDHYELTYYQGGLRRTDYVDQFGCPPETDDLNAADFPLNAALDLDRPLCTRTRGPLTDNDWTQPTCVTIHSDSSEMGNT